MKLHSYYPHSQGFSNYVPQEFEEFMDKTVQEWTSVGALMEWDKVRQPNEPIIPTVVSPLGWNLPSLGLYGTGGLLMNFAGIHLSLWIMHPEWQKFHGRMHISSS